METNERESIINNDINRLIDAFLVFIKSHNFDECSDEENANFHNFFKNDENVDVWRKNFVKLLRRDDIVELIDNKKKFFMKAFLVNCGTYSQELLLTSGYYEKEELNFIIRAITGNEEIKDADEFLSNTKYTKFLNFTYGYCIKKTLVQNFKCEISNDNYNNYLDLCIELYKSQLIPIKSTEEEIRHKYYIKKIVEIEDKFLRTGEFKVENINDNDSFNEFVTSYINDLTPEKLPKHKYPKYILAFLIITITLVLWSLSISKDNFRAAYFYKKGVHNFNNNQYMSAVESFDKSLEIIDNSKEVKIYAAKASFMTNDELIKRLGLTYLEGLELSNSEYKEIEAVMPSEYKKYFKDVKR